MASLPSILCPIDFSQHSRGALRYAAAIAGHFGARLTVLAVNDPLLQESKLSIGDQHFAEETQRASQRFFEESFTEQPRAIADVRFDVAVGKPSAVILRLSHAEPCDLIVMSSHGQSGLRKTFFGATTERVLRETTVPVLVTPVDDTGPDTLHAARVRVHRVLAPVDFTAATAPQLAVADGLATALGVPVLLLHAVEPAQFPPFAQRDDFALDEERRLRAEGHLQELAKRVSAAVKTELVVVTGEPADEISKAAQDRDAGLIVMGLHSSSLLGPRMGSVTYRVLCRARRLVLALPPAAAGHASAATKHAQRTALPAVR